MSSAAIKLLHADSDGFTRLFGQALYDEYAALFGLEQGPASLQSIVISADGVTWTFTFSRAVTSDGTGFSGEGVAAGAVALTYSSGSGTTALVFTGDTEVPAGDTATADYDAGVGNVADTDANELASFTDETVTNQSEFEPESPPALQLSKIDSAGTTMTWQMDRNTTITDATGVSITADGGAVTPTYSSGSGTRIITFTLSRQVVETEHQVTSYDAGTGNIESTSGAVVLASFSNAGIQSHVPVTHSGEEIPNPAWNATVRVIASGDWDDDAATVFDTGVVPTSTDRVQNNGFDLTISSQNPVCRSLYVKNGSLTFDPAVNTRLTAATVLFGDTAVLVTGTDASRVAADKTCEIVIADVAQDTTRDPHHWWNQLIFTEHDWDWTARGAVKTTEASDLTLAVAAEAGHTSVTLASAPTGWRIGDTIVIPPTMPIRNDFLEVTNTNAAQGWPMEPEERVITGIVGAVVSFADPLEYDHTPGVNQITGATVHPWVQNQTRNIVVRSENPSGTRGCIMLSHRPAAKLTLEYVEARDLGRTTGLKLDNTTTSGGLVTHLGTNEQGRYSLHFHHFLGFANGTSSVDPGTGYQATLTGLSITGFKKWGIVFHYASWMELVGANIYDGQTAGIVAGETGNEFENRIVENTGIAIRTYDHGHVLANFFYQIEPANAVVENNKGACTFQPSNADWFAQYGTGFEPYFGRIYHLNGPGHGSDSPSNSFTKRKPLYRGADVLNGVENTDYEVFNHHSTTWASWSNNQAWASHAGHSLDHFGTDESLALVIDSPVNIGHWENGYYVYGGRASVTINDPVDDRIVLQFILLSTQNGPLTINTPSWHGENIYAGFTTSPDGASFTGGFDTENRLVLNGGEIECVTCIRTAFPGSAGSLTVPEIESGARVMLVDGTALSTPNGLDDRLLVFLPLSTSASLIPMATNQIFLIDFQGSGVNYQVFADDQDPDAPAPYDVSYVYGATAAGRTNAEEQVASGRATGGELTPAGATTLSGIVGAKVFPLLAAVVDADGETVTVTASTPMDTDGTGWSVTGSTSGSVALAYVSGTGTRTLVFTAASTLEQGETVTGAYDADTGDLAATLSGTVFGDLAFGVTNNSEQVGGGFDPADVPNLVIDLSADEEVYEDTGATDPVEDTDIVKAWVARAGSGTLTEATNGPTYHTGAYVSGDGSNDILAGAVANTPQPFEMFFIVRRPSASSGTWASHDSGANDGWRVDFTGGLNITFGGVAVYNFTDVDATVIPTGGWHVVGIRVSTTQAIPSVDGTDYTTVSVGTMGGTPNQLSLFNLSWFANAAAVDLNRFSLFARVLDAGERSDMVTYLSAIAAGLP